MIGGCQRRMYYVRDTGSRMFREAYFILREQGAASVSEADLASEADRILRERFPSRRRRIPAGKWLYGAFFAAGAVVGAVLTVLVV